MTKHNDLQFKKF